MNKKRRKGRLKSNEKRLRLSVFRSNKNIFAQIIDDKKGVTLVSSSSLKSAKLNKIEMATEVGKNIAEKALEKNINFVVFDRASYRYWGRVKALAEAARAGGLKF